MGTNHEDKTKENRITEEVFLSCVAKAAMNTPGVYSLAERLGASLSKNLLGKTSLRKGIKVSRGEKGPIGDIFVVVQYGVHIPDVAFNIQSNVKGALRKELELKTEAVNIHINGVHTTKDKV